MHSALQHGPSGTRPQAFSLPKPPSTMNGNLSPDYSSSSASSSPRPPLPDAVLRSLRFPERQRDGTSNGNGTEAHTQGAGERVRHPVSADDHGAGTIADAAIPAQDRVDMDWSGFSDHDLDLVIANLEARASERRNKVRKIEALSEELGLNIHQQDWAALVRRPASVSGPSMAGSRDNFGQDEIQHQVDAPEDAEPMSVSETQPIHELTIADNDSANSSPDVQAEPEAPRRSLRIGHGLKRGHDQMEHQRSDSANSRDDGEVEEVAGEHETGGQSDSSMNAVPRRTAWSVVLETYPEEIAKWFKPGKRPTNERVRSLVRFSTLSVPEV